MNRRRVCAPAARWTAARGAGTALLVAVIAAAIAIAAPGTGVRADAAVSRAAVNSGTVVRPGAASGTASTTVGRGADALALSATPARGLAPYGAQIEVRGSGFDTSSDLWVAVCQDDGAAPASFANCIGGAIPDGNGTSAWAVISSAQQPPYAGPVIGSWHRKGSFDVTLQIPAAAGQGADCLASPCSVYTRSSDNANRSQDARVPVAFSATVGSGGSGGATTQTVGAVATTVSPDSVAATSVAAGARQLVTFSGYTPGEVVDVTLYSDPITLPATKADGNGVVTVSFTVPADLPPGEHLVQAVGKTSGRVGIASFEVGAPATTGTSSTGTATSTAGTTGISTPASGTTAVAGAAAPGVTAATSAPVTTAPTETSGAAPGAPGAAGAAGGDGTGGVSRLLWLWIVLLALVLIGGAAGLVVALRRRRDRADDEPLQPAEVQQPGWEAYPGPADRAGWPLHATDPTGGAVPATAAWSADPGPATSAWRPDFAGGDAPAADPGAATQGPATDPGSPTQEWRPEPEVAPPDAAPPDDRPTGGRPTGGRHRSE